jgi:hypothetical protein
MSSKVINPNFRKLCYCIRDSRLSKVFNLSPTGNNSFEGRHTARGIWFGVKSRRRRGLGSEVVPF